MYLGLYAKQIEELENIFFNHESAKYFIDGICDELGKNIKFFYPVIVLVLGFVFILVLDLDQP